MAREQLMTAGAMLVAIDIAKARNELGWAPTLDLERMVADTVAHLKESFENHGP